MPRTQVPVRLHLPRATPEPDHGCRRYGANIVGSVVNDESRQSTVRLVPQGDEG